MRNALILTKDDWELEHSEFYENIHAWGSGSETFIKIAKHRGTFKSAHAEDNILTIFQKNICLIAQLLSREKLTLQTLFEGWGGGFEAVCYNNDSLEKVDDIAYIINHGQYDGVKIGIPMPKVIVYHKYIDEVLFITALEIYKQDIYTIGNDIYINVEPGDYRPNLFVVPSIEQTAYLKKHELPTDFSFETIKITMGYFILGEEYAPYYPAYFTKHEEISVKFEYQKRIEIVLKKDFNDDVTNAATHNMIKIKKPLPI